MRPFLFSLIAIATCFASNEQAGRRAPGFALPDPAYEHYYDLQDFKGKVLVLDIMSTHCPHCQLLSTTLEQLKAKYGDRVAVLSVVLPPDNADSVAKYRSMNKITVPIVADQGQMTISYLNAKPGQAKVDVPMLFIIDKNGIIRNNYSYGDGDHAVFEGPGLYREIDKLLK